MESLSIWSLAGVVSNSAVIMAVRLSTQRVWHTFNYDVTVSNGVNLCHPPKPETAVAVPRIQRLIPKGRGSEKRLQ